MCAFASLYSFKLLIVSAELAHKQSEQPWKNTHLIRQGEPSYGSLGMAALGPWGAVLAEFSIALTSFGFAVSCLLEIGDSMPKLVEMFFQTSNSSWWAQLILSKEFWIFSKFFFIFFYF